MTTIIGEAINKILAGFMSFGISCYAEVASYYGFLEAEKRDAYIEKYERFWFTWNTLLGIGNELAFLTAKLEELRPMF